MQLWQATWDTSGNLSLWAEKSEIIESVLDQSAPVEDENHPFTLAHEKLEAFLLENDFEFFEKSIVKIVLPSSEDYPIPPFRLPLKSNPPLQSELSFKTWHIPVLLVDPLDCVNFLSTDASVDSGSIRFDQSVQFWRECTKLLLEILAAGKYLPGISREGSQWNSQWRPVLTDVEVQEKISILARSMPPICRALHQTRNTLENPSQLIESFLHVCTNALIRSFIGRTSLTENLDVELNSERQELCVRWLESLSTPQSVVDGSEYELTQLEHRLRSWSTRRYPQSEHERFATTIKVVEPLASRFSEKYPDDQWVLELCLRSNDSKEEIPAEDLWKGEIDESKQEDPLIEKFQQNFLRDLGNILSLFPEIKKALQESHPTHLAVDVNTAYHFMKDVAPSLEEISCKAILPRWWDQPSSSLGLSLKIATIDDFESSKQTLGRSELLDFSWQVSVGEQSFSIEQFKTLANQAVPLIEIEGMWTRVESGRLNSTLNFLENEQKKSSYTFGDAIRLGLGLEYNPDVLPVVKMEASGWFEKLISADTTKLPSLTPPKSFTGSLRPYQLEGLKWLSFLSELGIGACLADDMGLGKTIQLISLMALEREKDRSHPDLLIVPMSVLANWENEISRFAPHLKYYTHHGTLRAAEVEFEKIASEVDVVITTYSLLQREEKLFSRIRWKRITLDEAQNIKNIDAKQTKAARKISRAQLAEFNYCHRLALTGTPLENHLQELWSIMDFLNPGLLSTSGDFRKRFSIPIERNRNEKAREALSRILKPFILRRLKSDPKVITELPDKIEMESFTTLTEEQSSLYQSVLDHMLREVDSSSGIHRKGLVLSTITKLKQICDHPELFLRDGRSLANRSGKLTRLEELLEVILAEDDKVLIFTQYAQMGHLLRPYLQERFGAEILFLHGSLSRKARDQLITRFQSDNGPQIFILSLRAGGHGLNLTNANQVIHYDQWWNPAVREQATDRAHRIGQTQRVQVRRLICRGTLEERIEELVGKKQDLAKQVIGSTKSMITQMDLNQLRELLQLAED